jgi:hypothetical protein
MPDATVLAAVPIYLNTVNDSKKEEQVSSRFSNTYFSTDWGIRMIEDSNKKYRHNSYHAGMVWPLYGGWAALAEYKSGHFRSGFQHIMNNLLIFRHWSPGSIEETLNGDVYKPNGVCSHQCWSETMVLQPAIEGMLGLKPDAMANRLELSPYFPWHWEFCSVHNIRMKDALIHLNMKRSDSLTTFTINANKSVSLDFNPVFPLHTTISAVKINDNNIAYRMQTRPQGLALPLSFISKSGDNIIEVRTDGGIGILPVINLPKPGDSSTGIRILSERVDGRKYTVEISGRPNALYELQLYHRDSVKNISGAELVKQAGNIFTLKVKLGGGIGNKYVNKTIIADLQ